MTKNADILLVDDDEVMAFVAARYLTDTGMKLKACFSAEEAYDYLSEHSVRLILLDLRMPVMSGDQLLEKLVKTRKLNGARVCICTSAMPSIDVQDKLEALGAALVLKDDMVEKNQLIKMCQML